jgi:F0F1-type ATP synthase assembly protein I
VFKNRAFVSGIGIGIIVGALLLQVMLARPSAPSQQGISLEEMDPQKLKEETSKYYQVLEKNVKMYTQAELDAALQKKLKDEADKQAASKPQDQPKASQPAAASSKIVIYVQQNLDASTVADLLFRSGVISDRKAFVTELDKQGGSTKIQVGYHEFEGVMDMQTIVKNLITVQ